jgi:hypothetical protein
VRTRPASTRKRRSQTSARSITIDGRDSPLRPAGARPGQAPSRRDLHNVEDTSNVPVAARSATSARTRELLVALAAKIRANAICYGADAPAAGRAHDGRTASPPTRKIF